MTPTHDQQPAPLRISRVFRAKREAVFQAWSSGDRVSRWFCPDGFSVPQARVEMQVGGAFDVCMQAPNGVEHWSRGFFTEVIPGRRLVVDFSVTDAAGHRLFRALTEVDFVDVPEGTRMDVVQTYTFEDPRVAAGMVEGAPAGWRQTLDKLEVMLARGRGDEPERSVVHATFDLERIYRAPVKRVFEAFSEISAKAKWFSGIEGRWRVLERHMEFEVGGRERLKGQWESGVVTTFDAIYHDIVPNERIVYTYEMHQDDRKISVSLATVQMVALSASETRLKVTEQGAFLDGDDDGGSRLTGTGFLLDRLGASLDP